MEKEKREFITPKKEPLTIEKRKEMTGQNYSDEEAHEIVADSKALSVILAAQMREEDAMKAISQ